LKTIAVTGGALGCSTVADLSDAGTTPRDDAGTGPSPRDAAAGGDAGADASVERAPFAFFVSPTGSDENDGLTRDTPWAITAINTRRDLYRGRRVALLDGTYDLSGMSGYNGGDAETVFPILQVAAGAAGGPTVIESFNPRGAVLELTSKAGARNARVAIGQFAPDTGDNGHVVIDGLEVRGGAFWLMSFWGLANDDYAEFAPGVVVQNCHLHDTVLASRDNCPAIWLDRCIDPIVRNCKFHDIADLGEGPGPCAVMTLGVRGLVMEYNECYDTRVFLHDKHNDSPGYANDGFIVRHNYVHDIRHPAIIGFDTEYTSSSPKGPYEASVVHNNLFVGCAGGLTGKIDNPTRMRVSWFKNTFVLTRDLSGDGGVLTLASAATEHTIDCYDNVTATNGHRLGGFGYLSISTGCAGTIGHNCYTPGSFAANIMSPIDSFNGTTSFETESSLVAWQAALEADGAPAGSRDENSIEADPAFVAEGDGVAPYRLTAASSCRGAGRDGGDMGMGDGRVGTDW
jgi:hypothetical protein